MNYLLIYLSIGVAVSLLMAIPHMREGWLRDDSPSGHIMMDVFVFIALAWPVSIVAFLLGAFTHFLSVFQGSSHSS